MIRQATFTRGKLILLASLVFAILGSALAVAHTKYQSRLLFVDLQEIRKERDQLDMNWGRLQLELGTWGSHSRVEDLARNHLEMRLPKADEIVVVRY